MKCHCCPFLLLQPLDAAAATDRKSSDSSGKLVDGELPVGKLPGLGSPRCGTPGAPAGAGAAGRNSSSARGQPSHGGALPFPAPVARDGLVEELGSKRNLQGTLPRAWIGEEMAGCGASTAAGLPVGVAAPAELACTNAGASRLVLRASRAGAVTLNRQPRACKPRRSRLPRLGGREGAWLPLAVLLEGRGGVRARARAPGGHAPGRKGRSAGAGSRRTGGRKGAGRRGSARGKR